MRKQINAAKDICALLFAILMAPILRLIAKNRQGMPRFQRFVDRAGFQIRSTHYYEPTYSEDDLPVQTAVVRALPGLDFRERQQLILLDKCKFAEELKSIPMSKLSAAEFGYDNIWYGFSDAEMYYNIIRLFSPKNIIEIGSGNSTLMANIAVRANQTADASYKCRQICIEPFEMSWLERTGVTVLRQKVEAIELKVFDELNKNDILFIDSSHVIRPWGDVLREFQEIIPRLASGVLVHVHDIFTPRDYPERWLRVERRLWNEQYLLEAFLAFNDRFEIICMSNWLKHTHFAEFSRACPTAGSHPSVEPSALWFKVK